MTLTMLDKRNKYLNLIGKFSLMDDDFMKVALNDLGCLEFLLSRILKQNISIIEFQKQYELSNISARGLRIDVIAKTQDGRYINIEVQRQKAGAHPKRSRFHESLITTNMSYAGDDWVEVPPVIVIFICDVDIFGEGLQIYHIHRRVDETGKVFLDDSEIIYINATVQDDSELGRIIHDFHCTKADNMYCSILRNRMRYLKEGRGVEEMCKIMEELKEEGLAEGRNEGLAEGRNEGLAEGRIQTLMKQIEAKFGSLSQEMQNSIMHAKTDKLDELTVKLLFIQKEDEIFNLLYH